MHIIKNIVYFYAVNTRPRSCRCFPGWLCALEGIRDNLVNSMIPIQITGHSETLSDTTEQRWVRGCVPLIKSEEILCFVSMIDMMNQAGRIAHRAKRNILMLSNYN